MCDLLRFGVQTRRCVAAVPCNGVIRLPLGSVRATASALSMVSRYRVCLATVLARHACGDWGDVSPDAIRANDLALKYGGRVLSTYRALSQATLELLLPAERRRTPAVWVLTERDFVATTVLTPEDL